MADNKTVEVWFNRDNNGYIFNPQYAQRWGCNYLFEGKDGDKWIDSERYQYQLEYEEIEELFGTLDEEKITEMIKNDDTIQEKLEELYGGYYDVLTIENNAVGNVGYVDTYIEDCENEECKVFFIDKNAEYQLKYLGENEFEEDEWDIEPTGREA